MASEKAHMETQPIRAVDIMAKARDSSSQVDALALDIFKEFNVKPTKDYDSRSDIVD